MASREFRPPDQYHVPRRKLCKFYQKGWCRKGVGCDFWHDPSQKLNIEYQNPNEAKDDEEELSFDSRSDFLFAVGHHENSIRKLKESADDIPVRVCWSGLKMFLGGSPEQREKFKNTLHQCLRTKEIGSLPIPECFSVHYVIGRQGKTLRDVSESTNTFCMARYQGNEREIEIIAYTEKELDSAKEFLKAKLFSQPAVDGSILCFDTASSAENLIITFKPYTRYTPIRLRKKTVHEMCLTEKRHTMALTDAEETTLVKGLRLSLEETEIRGDLSPDRTSKMPPRGYLHEENVLYFRQWTRDHLKKLETDAETSVPKIEVRFGKVLWTGVPPDIATSEYSILEFEQEDALRLRTAFATFTDSDLIGLTDGLPAAYEVESYDLKVLPRARTPNADNSRSTAAERNIDLRVIVTDGHFNLVAAFGDESQKTCADWIILDGKHDFRIAISARKVLPLKHAFLQLVHSLRMEDEDCISYENTSELAVHYIRHKKKRCYSIKDYSIALCDIREFDVDQCGGMTVGARQTAHFKSQIPHCEIELQNRKWMTWFYAAAGHSLDSTMAAEQCLPPEDVSGCDQRWKTEEVLLDLPEFLEHVISVCEILTSSTD